MPADIACGRDTQPAPGAGAPLVTVVIPTYNSAWSIGDTLASVLAQRISDLEILVVNDGSTDDLDCALRPFLEGDARIRVIAQENRGLAGARNRGLAAARGGFVAFLDADDLWHPDFLAACLAALRHAPAAPFAYAYSRRIDEDGRILPGLPWRHVPRHDLAGLVEVNTVANGSAAVFRRSDVKAAGGFDPSMRAAGAQGAEDWKLILTLAAKATPALVPRALVAYRVAGRSMSRSNPDTQLRGIYRVIDHVAAAHPGLPARHLRNARTVMNGWMLDAFLAAGRYGKAAALLWVSYARNPLCFLSRDVRALHVAKLYAMLHARAPRDRLADLVEDGIRPFAFLDRPPGAIRVPSASFAAAT